MNSAKESLPLCPAYHEGSHLIRAQRVSSSLLLEVCKWSFFYDQGMCRPECNRQRHLYQFCALNRAFFSVFNAFPPHMDGSCSTWDGMCNQHKRALAICNQCLHSTRSIRSHSDQLISGSRCGRQLQCIQIALPVVFVTPSSLKPCLKGLLFWP